MRRRHFIGAICATAVALPVSAGAQQPGKVWRIGDVGTSTPEIGRIFVQALEQSLADLGYVQGRNNHLTGKLPYKSDELRYVGDRRPRRPVCRP
jgi:hypothetical protein